MTRLLQLLAIAPITLLLLGLVVDGANQRRYERAPADDPGFAHVGRRGTTSAVYLGAGWVLTARHSAVGEVRFGEGVHAPVEGSMVWLEHPVGTRADLMLFRVEPEPKLPALRIRRAPLRPGMPVVMVGYGAGRGDATSWNGHEGFRLAPIGTRRWGLGSIGPEYLEMPGPIETLTRCFRVPFTPGGVHQAFAGTGDSGGAVFVRGADGWQLAGVMLSVSRLPGQAPDVALFGSATNAADLSVYAETIAATVGRKTASD